MFVVALRLTSAHVRRATLHVRMKRPLASRCLDSWTMLRVSVTLSSHRSLVATLSSCLPIGQSVYDLA